MKEAIIISIVVLFCINFAIAELMDEIAKDKGYDKTAVIFGLCFLLGIPGCLYVIALPDRKLRQTQEDLLNCFKLAFFDEIKRGEITKNEATEREKRENEEQRILREKEELRKESERIKSINNYWELHLDEKKALLAKQQEAKNKINELGAFDNEEKLILQKLVEDIDKELTRDR